MNKRRERTLQDICDATQPQITPVFRGNIRMQGPADESNCDLLTHMGLSSCSENQKVDYRGKSGTCNVCSAPCSSCFHVNEVLMKPNDESAGETGAMNIETGRLSLLSNVAGMNSTSDSFSGNAVGKTSSRTSNASASDDGVVHSKSKVRRVPEGHDDCLSCVSETDEHENKKRDTKDGVFKYNKPSKFSGSSDKVQNTISEAFNGNDVSQYQNLMDVKGDKTSGMKNELLEGSTGPRDLLSPRGVATDVVYGDPPATALNSIQKNDKMEVEFQPIAETDDSDMMEQDVKVCDICGDAGREDLLAICSWCSDGAEHTYCMREMRAEVPEGEWLCEECQSLERAGNGREEKIGIIDENEKNNSGQTSSEYINSSDIEGQRTKGSMRISSKRHRDDEDAEVSSLGRIDENEKNNSGHTSSEYVNCSDVEGQRTKGSKRIPSKRHRDDADAEVSSLVKKPALESKLGSPKPSNSGKAAVLTRENSLKNLDKGRLQSSDIVPVNDTTESASSGSDLRGHSFRGTFSKSNSFSFLNSKPKIKLVDQVVLQRQKSAKEPSSFCRKEGLARSIGKSMSFKSTNSGRSESKVKMLSPRVSRIQDLKNTKQSSPFEHQHSFRTERSSINSVMGTSVSSTSKIDKRPASQGESSSLAIIANHQEMKPVIADSKSAALSRSSSLAARKTADISSSSGEFKRPSIHGHSTFGVSSASGVNNNEKKYSQTSLKEDSSCSDFRERPTLNADEGVPDGLPRNRDLTNSGERMKECSGSRSGLPPAKYLRDEGDNLRAAIEAAMLRKPGVYRKHRALGQSVDSSGSSLGCDVAFHQDPISSYGRNKKLSSDAQLPEPERPTISRNMIADSLKQETSNLAKQSSLVPVEGLSSGGRDGVHISSSTRDVLSNVPEAMPLFLKSVAVPEHEYIWQGSFEICRSGKTFDSWDGIQAHLSTAASPKVTEAVNKFKSRILLYEVPRLSSWPLHFQEHGVREDNIAVFFFARDLESYNKIYKVLLDNMIKNDLALKGNVNGIELLIFPSSQLPVNSQRWNMLFFLWGVFIGKKESCLQQMPESLNQICTTRNIPPPIMSFPENRCSLRPIAEDLHGSEDPASMPVSEELHHLLSSGVANRDSGTESVDHRLNSSSVQCDNANQCQERTGASQVEDMSSSCSPPPLGIGSMVMQFDTPVDEGCVLDKTCKQNQMKTSRPPEDGETRAKDQAGATKDPNNNSWLFNHEKHILMLPPPGSGSSSAVYADAIQKNHHECNESAVAAAERRFFPTESQFPWKMGSQLEQRRQDRVSDRAPDLELALGAAERKSLLDLTAGSNKVNSIHEEEGGGAKTEDHVAEASLSLSLSFPFPPEQQIVTGRERVNTSSSMLLFGNLGDR